jgi:hypothetical protein
LPGFFDQKNHDMPIAPLVSVIIWLVVPIAALGQPVCSEESSSRLDSMLQRISREDFQQQTIQEATVAIGKWFLDTPYEAKTLELPGDERLVINLTGLDCTTYLETVVTLARLARLRLSAFEEYAKELEHLRYRDGKQQDYPSRLHYFSDWIYENEQKGILTDITKQIGGESYPNSPGFMSSHPELYWQLEKKDYLSRLKAIELTIKGRNSFYIPQEEVERLEAGIRSGDLIAITIDMDDLDIAHVGVAVKQNGRIHLMHASSSAKKVVISSVPLSDYLKDHTKQTGIMVCRFKEP